MAISPGSSGGGLFNTKGELVGITTFYLKDGQSLNFAVPVEWIDNNNTASKRRFSSHTTQEDISQFDPPKIADAKARFTTTKEGIITDNLTKLQWYVGPEEINWYKARTWAENLTVSGGGWSMPTLLMLKASWQENAILDGMKPLGYMWSSDLIASDTVRIFLFTQVSHQVMIDNYLNISLKRHQ